MKFTVPESPAFTTKMEVRSICFSWVYSKLYFMGSVKLLYDHFVYYDEDTHVAWSLYEVDEELMNKVEIEEDIADENVNMLATDSEYEPLYMIKDEKELYSYEPSKTPKVYKYKSLSPMSTIERIVPDLKRSVIYVIGTMEDSQYYMASVDYFDTKLRVLYSGSALSNPTAFDVFDELAVWINREDDKAVLYNCRLTPECWKENLTRVMEWTDLEINDLKIAGPKAQSSHPCKDMGCSHKCSVSDHRWACVCSDGMSLGRDNKTCQVLGTADRLNRANYVGCYSTNTLDIQASKVNQPLAWDQGIHLCDSRLSPYVGIQEDRETRGLNYVYCIHELPKKTLNDSQCVPCNDNFNRSCGNLSAISAYQLRDKTPTAVLMATGRGVVLSYVISETETVVSSPRSSSDQPMDILDYNYAQDEVFTISKKAFYKSYYSPLAMRYLQLEMLTTLPCNNISAMVVDWVENSQYFSCYDGRFGLWKANVDSPFPNPFLDSDSWFQNLQDMAIDPYKRVIFFVQDNELVSFGINTKRFSVYNSGKYHLKEIHNIALDIDQGLIYMIGKEDDDQFFLVARDYEDTKTIRLYSGPKLSDPIALDVYKGVVVFLNRNGDEFTLHRCLTIYEYCDDSLSSFKLSEPVNDIKIYLPGVQTFPFRNCKKIGCSHLCVRRTKCSCPDGMVIGVDNKTCIDISTEDTSTSSDMAGLKEPSTTEFYSSPSLVLTEGNAVELVSTEVAMTENPHKLVHEEVVKTSGLELFNAMLEVLILIVLLVLVYLQLRPLKWPNFSFRSNNGESNIELRNGLINM